MTHSPNLPPSARTRPAAVLARLAPLLFLALLVVVFSVLAPRFLSALNMFNVLRQVSIYGIVAVGMTFVILTRGIDLSVGALVALTGMVGAVVAKGGVAGHFQLTPEGAGLGWPLAALAAITAGTMLGTVQGLIVARLAVPAFIVTLGGMTVFRGLTLMLGNGGPVSGFPPEFGWWGRGLIGPVPVPVLIFAAAAILAHVVLTRTRFGRAVHAVGSNPEAALLTGIAVDRVRVAVYAITGFCSGLAGFVLSARLNSAEAVAGNQYELTAIAAVVIGGTSLYGGTGSVAGTVIGALLTGVLLNGLVILNVSPYTQQVLVGLIIVAAVAFDVFIKRQSR